MASDHNPGPRTLLTQAEEKQLVWYCMERTRMGIGLTSAELAQEVKKILQLKNHQTPKGGFKPTKAWLQ